MGYVLVAVDEHDRFERGPRMDGEGAAVMTGGAAIVEALLAHGTEVVFGLPGAQIYPLFDALHAQANRITTIGTRHEQGCAYMAFGYARSTGRPGVFAVVPGPGVLNALAALCTAAGCCAPVLCITGQVPTAFIGRGRGHLHELPDQLATLRSVVKWAARIDSPADAPAVMAEAFRQMNSGKPGPVVVEMAWDAMASSGEVGRTAPRPAAPLAPDPASIEAAARLVAAGQRPMILVGSGAQHARAEVLALAEALNAPVAAFRGGRGVVPADHRLAASYHAARTLWPETDVAIGIGSRLEMPYMRWIGGMMRFVEAPEPPPHLVRIDIDPLEMERLKPHAGIVADAKLATAALTAALAGHDRAASWPEGRLPQVEAAARREVEQIQPHVAYLDVIRSVLPRDGVLVEELCQTGFTSYFAYPVYEPRTYVSPGFQGTLGFGYQAAIGAKVARPDRAVVSITGDGGFMFGVQELATAAQYGIALTTILFNNAAFGNVARDQETRFGGRLIASELTNPDFLALAASFGVNARRVTTPAELRPALTEALASGRPELIEVMVDRATEVSPWTFIM